MGKRFSALAVTGSVAVALSAVACGLGFSDIELGPTDAKPDPTGTSIATGTATTPPTVPVPTTDPDAGFDASLPDGAVVDSNLPEVTPPPTTSTPQVLLRYNVNYPCSFIPTTKPTCTQNAGSFPRNARYAGNAEPDYPFTVIVPLAVLDPKEGSVDLEGSADLVPTGAAPTKLTLAAWVKRAGTARALARIFSFANDKNGDKPVFELGYVNEADTKLVFSLDDALEAPAAKLSVDTALLGQDEWTFIAATFDKAAADELCFFRGVAPGAVTALTCVDYGGRNVRRPGSQPKLSIGHAARPAERAMAKSFPGRIDNAYVFVGEALDITELQKIFDEGHN